MTDSSNKETHGFQAEVAQILQLMIHSLYSNKEIFLRELISNASDACDKLRFAAVQDDSLNENDEQLAIRISVDESNNTLTISDNGIGMTRDEVIENIGTIARSGTKAFLESMTGDEASDSQLIGQFGVGFYSAFIVADKVTLVTRKAGQTDAVQWESAGQGDYTLENVESAEKGTQITLHLRDEEAEFLSSFRLQEIIRKYSDNIAFPILMEIEKEVPVESANDDDDAEVETTTIHEWEQINQASALWQRARSDIEEDEYKEFYKHISHDYADPLTWSHNQVEGKYEYTSLLYIPSVAPFDLYEREQKRGVQLYVQRVFIMEDPEQLMPGYLRFVRGLIDSSDLPLNVSREILQSNKVIDTIRSASVKKVLSMLSSLAKKKEDEYQDFWNQFGNVLKEGPGEDPTNSEKLAPLLRFSTTASEGETQSVSLADYVSRMQDGQKAIYYVTADNYNAAINSPHLEIFRKKGIEVLLLTDRIDEWLTSHLSEFEEHPLQSVAKGSLDLGDAETDDEKAAKEEVEKASQPLLERMTTVLGERVETVRTTNRLTDSPACLVASEFGMSSHLERMLKDAGQAMPNSKPTLEINPEHPLIIKMTDMADDEQFGSWTETLLDQAVLAEGGQLEDPAQFVRRINQMLLS